MNRTQPYLRRENKPADEKKARSAYSCGYDHRRAQESTVNSDQYGYP